MVDGPVACLGHLGLTGEAGGGPPRSHLGECKTVCSHVCAVSLRPTRPKTCLLGVSPVALQGGERGGGGGGGVWGGCGGSCAKGGEEPPTLTLGAPRRGCSSASGGVPVHCLDLTLYLWRFHVFTAEHSNRATRSTLGRASATARQLEYGAGGDIFPSDRSLASSPHGGGPSTVI